MQGLHQRPVELGRQRQRLHVGQRVGVRDIHQPRTSPGLERAVHPGQSLLELGDLAQHPHPLDAVLDGLQLGFEHRDQGRQVAGVSVDRLEHDGHAGALLGRAEQALEGGDGVLVRGAALQDLGIAFHGRRGISELSLLHLGQPHAERIPIGGLGGPAH